MVEVRSVEKRDGRSDRATVRLELNEMDITVRDLDRERALRIAGLVLRSCLAPLTPQVGLLAAALLRDSPCCCVCVCVCSARLMMALTFRRASQVRCSELADAGSQQAQEATRRAGGGAFPPPIACSGWPCSSAAGGRPVRVRACNYMVRLILYASDVSRVCALRCRRGASIKRRQ